MNNEPIVMERTFNVPVSKVWKALTNKDEMKKWYFDLNEFKPEVGFQFQFTGRKDDQEYLHLCEITEVIPEKKLTYSWRYDGYSGNSFVTFQLFPQGQQTLLRLTHSGIETFDKSNPDFDKKNFVGGWTQIVTSSLKDYLEK